MAGPRQIDSALNNNTPLYHSSPHLKTIKKTASGGKVSHLESWLPLRFTPRSSGQITSAFDLG